MKYLDDQLAAKRRIIFAILEWLHNTPVEELVGEVTYALDTAYKSTCMDLRDKMESLDLVAVGRDGEKVHLVERQHRIGSYAHTLCGLLEEFEQRDSPGLDHICPTCHQQAIRSLNR